MSRELVEIISDQTIILYHNFKTLILTCDMDFVLCKMPIWKHVYHALHSSDQWFINPNRYTEPSFHKPGLNSLDKASDNVLTRDDLLDYFDHVRNKNLDYLATLTDEMLQQKPDDCPYSRLALILGQFRHLYAHLGNINATTIIQTGQWPRVVGLDGDFSKGSYE
jgi:hypothetical protein